MRVLYKYCSFLTSIHLPLSHTFTTIIMASFIVALFALHSSFSIHAQATTLPMVIKKPIDVSITSQLLTDSHRYDPFANDGRRRSIMISIYTPVPNCARMVASPYMPTATSQFMDEKFSAYEIPNNTFASLNLSTCEVSQNHKTCAHRKYPPVIFSPALGTSRFLYSNLLRNIASAGYVVVSIDHPYDADIVTFPNGSSILGVDIPDSALVDGLASRVKDVRYLYDQLPSLLSLRKQYIHENAAVIGHSFGGATATSALASITQLRGGVNIDGTMFGSVLDAGVSQSLLLLGHENKTQTTDPSWAAIWPKLRGWKRELQVKGTQHYAFSDLPAIVSAMGLGGSPLFQQVLGSVEGQRMLEITTGIVVGFLDLVIKKDGGKRMRDVEREFQEI